MSVLQPSQSPLETALAKTMHEHWRVFLAEGILLVLLGFAAIVVPLVAGLAATVFLGWLFLMAGILGLVATFRARGAPGFGWALASAIAAVIAGAILLWNPFQGLITLTYVLIAYFVADGVLMILLAVTHRSELTGKWEWMAANGVIDIILALIIVSGLPNSLAWALGLLVGIDMVFGGASLIAMAMAARRASSASGQI
ncbi:MAG: HdeD family acid-resistance protein [Methylovirgula sp.]